MKMLKERKLADNVKEIVKRTRQRRVDLDIVGLLIACVEDVPQALIVVIVVNSNALSILNFALAVISFGWKLVRVT